MSLPNYVDFDIDFKHTKDDLFSLAIKCELLGDHKVPGKLRLPVKDPQYQELATNLDEQFTDKEMLDRLGQILFDALFRGKIKERLVFCQRLAQERDQRLRLRMIVGPAEAEVAALPWEFLYNFDEQALALNGISIVRYIRQSKSIPNSVSLSKLKVLLTGAQASQENNIERELEDIENILRESGEQRGVDVEVKVEPRLTSNKLYRLLKDDFHIWHFVGFGQFSNKTAENRLLFDSEEENSIDVRRPVDAHDLGWMLKDSKVRLIVLNACNSGCLAIDPFRSMVPALIRAEIPAIVAMQFKVKQKTAHAFASEFYRTLVEGSTIDNCMAEGRAAVALRVGLGHVDWGVPVLYSRVPDGKLFEFPQPESNRPEPSKLTEPFTEPEVPSATQERVIYTWIEGLAESEPLQIGQTYQLKFSADLPYSHRLNPKELQLNQSSIDRFSSDMTLAKIRIVLDSDDFRIDSGDQQPLFVPRTGASRNSLSFAIEPKSKEDGAGYITALFIVNNRVFQKMNIALRVTTMGASASHLLAGSSGLTLNSALALPPRSLDQSLSLVILKRVNGYRFIVLWKNDIIRASLILSEMQFADIIAYIHDQLKVIVDIVDTENRYRRVYHCEDTTISKDDYAITLKWMAELGYSLFDRLFYAPGNGSDAHSIGDLLRNLSHQHQLHIDIIAEGFNIPWTLLYDHSPLNSNNIDEQGFWGFRHVIASLPEYSNTTLVEFKPHIVISNEVKRLGLGFAFDKRIEYFLPKSIVSSQKHFFQDEMRKDVLTSEYERPEDLYSLFNNPESAAQLLYFFCRAVGGVPRTARVMPPPKITLTKGDVPLAMLQAKTLRAQPLTETPPRLREAPLVFVNACQSTELSPYLYDILVPYLAAKGARGVVGTAMDLPAIFAAEFGQTFVNRFVTGSQPLGELLLDLRREYLTRKHNILGLLYMMYANADIIVKRAI